MIDNQITTSIDTNAMTQNFSVELNSSMFAMLTKNVYTNVIAAPIREWSTNAVDACLAAGLPVRFDVHLPTVLEPTFSVRDYGTGLTDVDIKGLFSALGASTKRESNEFNGTFGIGRMSGLAYAEMFMIDSFLDGEKHSYAVSMQDGIPNMVSFGSSATDGPNGLELSLTVQEYDIYRFSEEALKIYQHFDTRPNVNLPMAYVDEPDLFRGDGWHISGSDTSYNLHIVMGNVKYELNSASIRNSIAYQIAMIPGLIVEAPLGSLSITPGRESLNLDDSTIAYIKAKVDFIKKDYPKKAIAYMNTLETDIDKLEVYSKRLQYTLGRLGYYGNDIRTNFNSEYIENFRLNFSHLPMQTIQIRKSNAFTSRATGLMEISKADLFVIGDTRVNHARSVEKYFQEKQVNKVHTYILKPNRWDKNPEAIESFIAQCEKIFADIGITNYIKTSDYEVTASKSTSSSGKISTINFRLNGNDDLSIVAFKGSQIEPSSTDTVYYIRTSGFKPDNMSAEDLSIYIRAARLYDQQQSMNGNRTETHIVGIPKSGMKAIENDDRFVPLEGALDEQFRDLQIIDYSLHKKLLPLLNDHFENFNNFPDDCRDFILKTKRFISNNPLHRRLTKEDGIAEKFGIELETSGSLLSYDEFREKYPLLIFLMDKYHIYSNNITIDDIENYANDQHNSTL